VSHVRFRTRNAKHLGVVGRGPSVSVELFTANSGMEGRQLLNLSVNDARTLAELLFKEATETEHRIFNTARGAPSHAGSTEARAMEKFMRSVRGA
jgi:hypothetical protein